MAQSAQTLFSHLLHEGILDVRKTEQDYRVLPLFLVRLVMNVIWADVVHLQISGHLTAMNAVIACILGRALSKPVIVAYKGGFPERFLRNYDLYLRPLLHTARVLVTTSFAAKFFRARGYDTVIIPNVVEVEAFRKRNRENGYGIIVCRHLKRLYNVAMALQAFSIIKEACPEASLTVVGGGPQREELAELAGRLGLNEVVFSPSVAHSDLPNVFGKAEVFLNPTDAVGIPVSLVEAAASGLVIVSVDTRSIREFITHGINGFLVPATDHESMARFAIAALRDEAVSERMSDAAKSTAARYSWSMLRNRYYALYNRSWRAS